MAVRAQVDEALPEESDQQKESKEAVDAGRDAPLDRPIPVEVHEAEDDTAREGAEREGRHERVREQLAEVRDVAQ